jgi:hypothetical protein
MILLVTQKTTFSTALSVANLIYSFKEIMIFLVLD